MSKIKNHTFVSLRNYIKGFFFTMNCRNITRGQFHFNTQCTCTAIFLFSKWPMFFFFQSYDPVNEFKIVVVKLLSSIITRLNAYHTKKWNRWFVILVQRLNISNWLTYTCSQYFNWSFVALLRTFRVA